MKKRISAAVTAVLALLWAPAALAGDASQDAMYRINQQVWSRAANGSSDDAMYHLDQQVWHRATTDGPVVYTDQARGIWRGAPDLAPYIVVDLRMGKRSVAKAVSAAVTQYPVSSTAQ